MINQDLRQAQANADQISRAMLQLLTSLKQNHEIDQEALARARHAFLQYSTFLRGILGNSHIYRA